MKVINKLKYLKKSPIIVVALIIFGFLLLPYAWMVIQSFQTSYELHSETPRIEPHPEDPFINYRTILLHQQRYQKGSALEGAVPDYAYWVPRASLNSFIVAMGSTLLTLLLASFPAYAYSRFKMRAKNQLMLMTLFFNMIPAMIVIIPLYMILRNLALINTHIGLIFVYTAFMLPYAIWMLYSYFQTVPYEMEESAKIDGCGTVGVIFRILLPIAAPGFAAVAIFVFLTCWNEFFFALILTSDIGSHTLPVVISMFSSTLQMNPHDLMITAGVVGSIPPLIIALLFQRYIISGLTRGAFK